MSGRLVLIGTPIGNREDLSARARRALFEADLLYCEDTRSPLRLVEGDADALPPRVSCFVGNEHERLDGLRDALAAGKTVAFVSEAGMPVWSDPGRQLVELAWSCGAQLDAVPGPTAAATALALSGFAAEEARFAGFVDRSGKVRKAQLADAIAASGATIFYEAGNRTVALLRDLAAAEAIPSARRVFIGRELTKRHQELMRAPLSELAAGLEGPLRGEVCVVLEGRGASVGASSEGDPGLERARSVYELMLDRGLKPRAKAKALAAELQLDAREVYRRLSQRDE